MYLMFVALSCIKGALFFEREGVCRRQRTLQVNNPPDKTSLYAPNKSSLYAPNKQVTQKYGGQDKTGSSVIVVGRFIALTQEVLSSFGNSDVGAFILIIRAPITTRDANPLGWLAHERTARGRKSLKHSCHSTALPDNVDAAQNTHTS